MKKYLKFIYVFLIIGFESLGNLSAVSAILEENLIKKNKWISEEDLIDAITIGRLGPGATTANVVAYLGNKIAGFLGGVVATVCYTIMPMIIISIIYSFLDKVMESEIAVSALRGTLACICAMFIKSSFDLGKSVLISKFNVVVFCIGLVLSLFLNISGVWIIIGAVCVGGVKVVISQNAHHSQ